MVTALFWDIAAQLAERPLPTLKIRVRIPPLSTILYAYCTDVKMNREKENTQTKATVCFNNHDSGTIILFVSLLPAISLGYDQAADFTESHNYISQQF